MQRDAFSRCHPAVNFIFYLGAIGFGVVIQHPAYLAMGFLASAGYFALRNPRKAFKTLLGLLPVFVVLAGVNPLFNTYGEKAVFFLFGRPYTWEALAHGMAVGGMFVIMLLWFMTYSQVLTADKFLSLFSWLIPSLALLLTMVLRLIPNLIRKANQILVSRRSIGKGVPEAASKKQRMKDGMNLVSALTDWLLEGSIITADSMRSRGYGTARRTSFQIYRFTARDGVLVGILLSLAAAVILLGGFEASYTPTWVMQSPGWGLLFYGAYLFVPMILQGKEELQWHISLSRI